MTNNVAEQGTDARRDTRSIQKAREWAVEQSAMQMLKGDSQVDLIGRVGLVASQVKPTPIHPVLPKPAALICLPPCQILTEETYDNLADM